MHSDRSAILPVVQPEWAATNMKRKEKNRDKENTNVIRPQQSVYARNLRVMTQSISGTWKRVRLCDYTKVLFGDIERNIASIYFFRNLSRADHFIEFRMGL